MSGLGLLMIISKPMLKGLKNKKDGKGDAKKDTKKEKQSKGEPKKQQEEEEEDTNEALVDINYDQKDKSKAKNTKKVQASKLQEKEIDITNIKIQKKEEKKQLKSWVVNAEDVDVMFKKRDFDATKHETEFESLTDHELNKQLEEKAKLEADKPKVEELNGIKYAPLQRDRVDVNEPSLAIRKPATVDVNINFTPQIPVTNINPPTFINTKMADFVPLEKSMQPNDDDIEKKMQQRGADIVLKGKGTSWLGGKQQQPVAVEQPKVEMKLSGWAVKAMQQGDINPTPAKFAELKISPQEKRYERQEQQFKYSSKKEQQERRKKREAEQAAKVAKQ